MAKLALVGMTGSFGMVMAIILGRVLSGRGEPDEVVMHVRRPELYEQLKSRRTRTDVDALAGLRLPENIRLSRSLPETLDGADRCVFAVPSKHALEGWSDCLRNELRSFGIQVVIIEPGAISTEFSGVALQNVLERSGSGPYGELAEKFVKMSEGLDGSHPRVIAEVIVKAVEAKKPKARYVAGKMGQMTISMRKWLGDGAYDRLLDSMLK